ncbi:MAG: hypothetical protein D6778_05290 [Nitrospirae bacterium]|nr:MAG: hypothetical protein D6778_05290 [Nitrospirota bacterium]
MGGEKVSSATERLSKEGIPNYSYPEEAMTTVSHLVRYSQWKRTPKSKVLRLKTQRSKAKSILREALGSGRQTLTEDEAREVLSSYGISFPRTAFVHEPEEAIRQAETIGYPVMLKVVSPDILHKTDVGGVVLDIENPKQLRDAYYRILSSVKTRMPFARIKGFFLSEMLKGGREVILGLTKDQSFGHLLMFGLGGVYVEVLKDVSFRVVPATERDLREMVQEIRTYSLLTGARGQSSVDVEAIVEVLAKLNQLAMELPEVQELDINPLYAMPEGAVALDARIILSGPNK